MKNTKKKDEIKELEDRISNPSIEMVLSNMQGKYDGYREATTDIFKVIFNSSENSKLSSLIERLKY